MISFSENGIKISETVENDSIIWIHALPHEELGPTNRIIEDLEPAFSSAKLHFEIHEVKDQGHLKQLFDDLCIRAADGLRPIVHFDAHGSSDRGLAIAASGERVHWLEIIDLLRALNRATQNNLVCIFALCFGLHLYKEVSLGKPVPAYLFCAPENEVHVGFQQLQTNAFYNELINTSNVTSALENTLGQNMETIHCQGLFLQSLLRYVAKEGSSASRQARQENLVSAILNQNGITHPTTEDLRSVRKQVKAFLKPSQKLIDLFASTFLVGRDPAFNFEDIEQTLVRIRSRRLRR